LHDTEQIERAAELGGCKEIIERLPEKYDTFLEMPIENAFSRIPQGTTSLFGNKNLHQYASGPGWDFPESHNLSGGEKQRLAL
jgi:ABC-type multidrug transport system fused ATPase/permease subunit